MPRWRRAQSSGAVYGQHSAAADQATDGRLLRFALEKSGPEAMVACRHPPANHWCWSQFLFATTFTLTNHPCSVPVAIDRSPEHDEQVSTPAWQ
jgi:hypothetical protein